jgi:hypothetical protein
MTFLMTFLMTWYFGRAFDDRHSRQKSTLVRRSENLMASPPRRGQCQQRRRPASCDMLPGPEIVYWVFGVSIYYSHFIVHICSYYITISGYPIWYPSFIVHFTHKYYGIPDFYITICSSGDPVFRSRKPHLWNANTLAPDLDQKNMARTSSDMVKIMGNSRKMEVYSIIAGQIIYKFLGFSGRSCLDLVTLALDQGRLAVHPWPGALWHRAGGSYVCGEPQGGMSQGQPLYITDRFYTRNEMKWVKHEYKNLEWQKHEY